MAKASIDQRDVIMIRHRLRTFAESHFGTWSAFLKAFGVDRTTASGWMHRDRPRVPDVAWLVRFARGANLSLDWLLLGEGSQLREEKADDGPERAVAAIKAELKMSEGMTPEEFQGAWTRLVLDDGDYLGPLQPAFRLAVDGVRARLRESLRLTRHYAWLAYLNQGLGMVASALRSGRPDLVERAEQRFLEILAVPADHFAEGMRTVAARHRAEPFWDGDVAQGRAPGRPKKTTTRTASWGGPIETLFSAPPDPPALIAEELSTKLVPRPRSNRQPKAAKSRTAKGKRR